MEELNHILINDLHLEPEKSQRDYLCQNFIVYPDGKELFGGFLFGIIEVRATPIIEAEKIILTIINTLKEEYYRQIMSSPEPQKLNLETIFEFALNKTNQKITELIQIGQINLIKENLHYFIGVSRPDSSRQLHIHFTNYGSLKANLLHLTKKNIFQMINILQAPNEFDTANDQTKIFSNVTSGQISSKDTLIVSTDIFNNYISPNKIKHVLLNNPLNEAITYFRSLIKNIQNKPSLTYSTLFICYHVPSLNEQPARSQKSINRLLDTEAKTEKLLAPNLALNLKKYFLKIFSNKNKSSYQPTSASDKNTGSTLGDFLTKIFNSIKLLLIYIFKNLYLLLTRHKKISFRQLKEKSQQTMAEKTAITSKKSPHLNKIIIAAAVVLAIILSFSIVWGKKQLALKQQQEQYVNQLQTVKNLISEAESTLIYRDKNKGLEKIQIALTELEYLPRATSEQQDNYQQLQKQIADIKNQIFNIEKVIPQLVIDLTIDGQPTTNKKILLFDNTILNFGASNLLVVDLLSKDIQSIVEISAPLCLGSANEDKVYLLDQKNSIYKFENNLLTQITAPINLSPKDMQLYNDNLYLLYNESQQINKLRPEVNSFSEPQTWIKDRQSANLTTATNISIDGSIYVVNQDGKINKFYAGNYESFNNPLIEPPLTDIRQIITSVETQSIYLVEPVSKRIVIINKSGELIKQLLFDTLDSIDYLIISTDNKTGYLLADSKLYQFSL